MLINYQRYLNVIQEKIDLFFEKQKDYIACYKGCGKCCKNAQFPYSEIEYKYLMLGFNSLSVEIQNKITLNIKKILDQKKNYTENKFIYECPFLIDNVCACYEYRGIVCRTFGLLSQGTNNSPQIPFCALENLNYSNVYDKDKNCISSVLYEENKIDTPPLVYNIDYETLTDKAFEDGFGFKFGKVKPLIDWFEDLNL